MNISRFFGATNREAMRQVRLALGPDALIISNKRVNGGVEILATDQTPEVLSSVPQRRTDDGQAPIRVAPAPAPAPASAASAPNAELIDAIGDLRGSLESRIDELLWGSQLRRAPAAVALFQTLLRFGFSTALLRAMLKRLPEQLGERAAFQWARSELIKHLPILGSEDELWRPGLALALVGPTGVGKTTTIAKLAARCVRRFGPDSLVLLTTDTYRIGAHEQLKIYGEMLRVPVHVVQDLNELRRIVQAVRPDQTVLVDNVGISQRDRYVSEQAALLAGAGRDIARLLVLNASSHGDTLDEVVRSYASDGGTPLRGCVITKIDEASRLGPALDTAIRYQLPIHYVSNGQKVPENLLFLPATALVDHALTPGQGRSTLYAPTEADLAALMTLARPARDDAAEQAAARQKAMLPRLLGTFGPGVRPLGDEELRAAVAALDEDPLLSAAHDLWRTGNEGRAASPDALVDASRRIAERERSGGRAAIVVHGRIGLHGARRGSWLANAWCDAEGRAVAIGAQQLLLPDGWHGVGLDAAPPPDITAALMAQAHADDGGPAALHVFDGGTARLWRTADQAGLSWLAVCGSRSRVHQDGEASTLAALGRRLPMQALAHSAEGYQPPIAGLSPSGTSVWVGSGHARLVSRGQAPLDITVLCLRAVDSRDGRERRSWYGIASGRAADDPFLLARAMLARHDCVAAWRASGAQLGVPDAEALPVQAVRAAQWGLAARALWRDPVLAPAAQVCARMLGVDALGPARAPAALMKLFALKDMLA